MRQPASRMGRICARSRLSHRGDRVPAGSRTCCGPPRSPSAALPPRIIISSTRRTQWCASETPAAMVAWACLWFGCLSLPLSASAAWRARSPEAGIGLTLSSRWSAVHRQPRGALWEAAVALWADDEPPMALPDQHGGTPLAPASASAFRAHKDPSARCGHRVEAAVGRWNGKICAGAAISCRMSHRWHSQTTTAAPG